MDQRVTIDFQGGVAPTWIGLAVTALVLYGLPRRRAGPAAEAPSGSAGATGASDDTR